MSKFKHQALILKAIMRERGASARDIAELLGVSDVYVSHMVNAKAGIPAHRAHVFGPNNSAVLESSALADFRSAWREEYKKGLQVKTEGGKGLKHEKQKAKKEKSKTKNRQL